MTQIPFIKQVYNVKYGIDELATRAKKENSEFQWQILNAQSAIHRVYETYHEVLQRDSSDSDVYIPPLKGVE